MYCFFLVSVKPLDTYINTLFDLLIFCNVFLGWMEPTGFALANATNGTIILVDYKNVSSCSYSRSVQEIVPSIGLYLAEVIARLNLDTDKIEMIGHSLGAHIAGYAGASLNGSIGRITGLYKKKNKNCSPYNFILWLHQWTAVFISYIRSGLDPAGPGFDSTKNGLNKTCAKFVQVLHTNPGELGTNEQRGDLNFYANNKTNVQPGCPFKQCGHAKAIFYYFASLFPQYEFIGVQCEQQDARQVDIDFIRFGFFNAENGYGRGNFCFNTTSCFPFTSNGSVTSTTIDAFTVKAFSTERTPSMSTLSLEDSSKCRDCDDFSDHSDHSETWITIKKEWIFFCFWTNISLWNWVKFLKL